MSQIKRNITANKVFGTFFGLAAGMVAGGVLFNPVPGTLANIIMTVFSVPASLGLTYTMAAVTVGVALHQATDYFRRAIKLQKAQNLIENNGNIKKINALIEDAQPVLWPKIKPIAKQKTHKADTPARIETGSLPDLSLGDTPKHKKELVIESMEAEPKNTQQHASSFKR